MAEKKEKKGPPGVTRALPLHFPTDVITGWGKALCEFVVKNGHDSEPHAHADNQKWN